MGYSRYLTELVSPSKTSLLRSGNPSVGLNLLSCCRHASSMPSQRSALFRSCQSSIDRRQGRKSSWHYCRAALSNLSLPWSLRIAGIDLVLNKGERRLDCAQLVWLVRYCRALLAAGIHKNGVSPTIVCLIFYILQIGSPKT